MNFAGFAFGAPSRLSRARGRKMVGGLMRRRLQMRRGNLSAAAACKRLVADGESLTLNGGVLRSLQRFTANPDPVLS